MTNDDASSDLIRLDEKKARFFGLMPEYDFSSKAVPTLNTGSFDTMTQQDQLTSTGFLALGIL